MSLLTGGEQAKCCSWVWSQSRPHRVKWLSSWLLRDFTSNCQPPPDAVTTVGSGVGRRWLIPGVCGWACGWVWVCMYVRMCISLYVRAYVYFLSEYSPPALEREKEGARKLPFPVYLSRLPLRRHVKQHSESCETWCDASARCQNSWESNRTGKGRCWESNRERKKAVLAHSLCGCVWEREGLVLVLIAKATFAYIRIYINV